MKFFFFFKNIDILLKGLSDRHLHVHHGSRDAKRNVALVFGAVHVLDRAPGERIDEDSGGVGLGHAPDLQDNI